MFMRALLLVPTGYVFFALLPIESSTAQHWAGPNEDIPRSELQARLDRIDLSSTGLMIFLSAEDKDSIRQEMSDWSRGQVVHSDEDDVVKAARRKKFEELVEAHVSATRSKPLLWDDRATGQETFSCVIPFRNKAKKVAEYVSLMGADNDEFLYQARVTVEYEDETTAPKLMRLDSKYKSIKRATVNLMITADGARAAGEISPSSALQYGRGRYPVGNSCYFKEVTFFQ